MVVFPVTFFRPVIAFLGHAFFREHSARGLCLRIDEIIFPYWRRFCCCCCCCWRPSGDRSVQRDVIHAGGRRCATVDSVPRPAVMRKRDGTLRSPRVWSRTGPEITRPTWRFAPDTFDWLLDWLFIEIKITHFLFILDYPFIVVNSF